LVFSLKTSWPFFVLQRSTSSISTMRPRKTRSPFAAGKLLFPASKSASPATSMGWPRGCRAIPTVSRWVTVIPTAILTISVAVIAWMKHLGGIRLFAAKLVAGEAVTTAVWRSRRRQWWMT
jgi:hypothetical protein